MWTSRGKKTKIFVISACGMLILLGLWLIRADFTDAQSRIGLVIAEEADTSPSNAVYKFVFPNNSLSISNAVATFTETGGTLSNIVEDTTPQLGGDLDLNSKNIDFPTTANVSDCKDEDDMASNSATMLATQQSIKAYVDTVASGKQPLEATLTDIADGTITENLTNTANPWADNEVADTLTVDGSSSVDPDALTGDSTDDNLVDFAVLAPIQKLTLKASELNDTSDPHTLIAAELQNKILTNSESVGADEWDFPARAEGWNFMFIIEAAQNVTLDPNGTEQWYLNGVQMAAGEAIVNTAPTVGEVLECISTESAVYCESNDPDWQEETP